LAALVCGVVAVFATACTSSDSGVSTGPVGRSTVTEVVDVPATVTARAVATLTAPSNGTLTQLAVTSGSTVSAGTVLAVIDSPTATQRLAQASAALSAASGGGGIRTTLDLTGAQHSLDSSAAEAFAAARSAAQAIVDPQLRATLLAQLDAAVKQYAAQSAAVSKVLGQVQRGVAGLGSAVAALGAAQRAQAQAAYDLAKSDVDALTLRAPIAGVVQLGGSTGGGTGNSLSSLLDAAAGGSNAGGATLNSQANGPVAGADDTPHVGDPVAAGQSIVTIVDVSEIGLIGEVDETDVLLVHDGVPADVELDAAPGQRYEALVGPVDLLPTASSSGGVAYRVRLSFTNLGGADGPPTPRPGMSAVAHLRVRTAVDAVAVPAAAVFTDGSASEVWVVGTDGRAVRQTVTVGVQGQDSVQIVTGLRVGERIVVTGADRVTAGQSVS
jgi:multidrug efflux pump subunit AcrA (membrane-fusion protein)